MGWRLAPAGVNPHRGGPRSAQADQPVYSEALVGIESTRSVG